MTISELIAHLEKLKAEHGDLRCVTPGFDEYDFDDVGKPEIVAVKFKDGQGWSAHRSPSHGEAGEPAVMINF